MSGANVDLNKIDEADLVAALVSDQRYLERFLLRLRDYLSADEIAETAFIFVEEMNAEELSSLLEKMDEEALVGAVPIRVLVAVLMEKIFFKDSPDVLDVLAALKSWLTAR